MSGRQAEELGGKLSYPSKMDCPAWAISAFRCRIGSVLAQKENSTCRNCYALKGTFRFKNVNAVLEENYRKLWNTAWTPAMVALIRWHATDRFRWFLAGDLQGKSHLLN